MSAPQIAAAGTVSPAMSEAAAIVLRELIAQAKPKALARARAALLDRAETLETWGGCRLPAGVVLLHEWRQERVLVAERRERAEVAAAIRSLMKVI